MQGLWQSEHKVAGGIVKRSLAMVFWPYERAIAKTFGLDAATRNIVYEWLVPISQHHAAAI
jgi:hypothetical protein